MHALTRCVMDMRNGWECFVMDAWGGIVMRREEQMCIVTIRPLVSAALCSARCVTGHQAFRPEPFTAAVATSEGCMHIRARRPPSASAAAVLPRMLASGPSHACVRRLAVWWGHVHLWIRR